MNKDFRELILSCSSWQVAQQVVDVLLDKRLAVLAEIIPVPKAPRIHVLVKTQLSNIEKIEAELGRMQGTAVVSSTSLVQ